MMTITTVSLASGKGSKGGHYDDNYYYGSLVRDPRVIMMMTTTIPREARVDTMMTDMVAREVNWGSCAFLITPNVILIPQIVAVRVLLAPWRLMMALSFVENPMLPLIQSCRQSFCEGLQYLLKAPVVIGTTFVVI